MRVVIGCDPGASASLSLVAYRGPGTRPILMGAWSVWGRFRQFRARLDGACSDINDLLVEAQVKVADVVMYVETPASSGRTKRGKYGPGTWFGTGRAAGWLELGVADRLDGVEIYEFPMERWPPAVSRGLPRSKSTSPTWRGQKMWPTDGWHRVEEASRYLDGAADFLKPLAVAQQRSGKEAEAERVVCLAESMLIGAAGALGGLQKGRRSVA